MNRICLKRKEMQRKNSIPATLSEAVNQNVENKEVETCQADTIATKHEQDNNRIFEEFKNQYDQLRKQYEDLRKVHDDTARDKKKLQISFMNSNPQYYQKEIKRLRTEVERLQEDNEQLKHKYYVAENSKRQMESNINVKTEELKRTLKQLQKQKISVVEAKHQTSEKQKFYNRIITEVEKSTQVLRANFEEVKIKADKTDDKLKNKEKQFQKLYKNYENLTKEKSEGQKTLKKAKQIVDQTNETQANKINELESKIRGLDRNSRETIDGLQTKIQELNNYRKTENLFVNEKIESAANMRILQQNQLEIVRLEEINKDLRADLENQKKLTGTLEKQLVNSYSSDDYKQLEDKLSEVQKKVSQQSKLYEQKLLAVQKQNEMLKMRQLTTSGNVEKTQIKKDFQSELVHQVEQNIKIKQELAKKVDEVYKLKNEIDEMKCKQKCCDDQILLLNKKIKSQQKNNKIQSEVSTQNLKNEIDSLTRKLETTTNKLESKVKEIKEKESFIMSAIVGRSRQEDVPLITAELQRIFEAEYATKLNAALLKIEQLERSK